MLPKFSIAPDCEKLETWLNTQQWALLGPWQLPSGHVLMPGLLGFNLSEIWCFVNVSFFFVRVWMN